MKRAGIVLFYAGLILVSSYVLVAGIGSLNGNMIHSQINHFMQLAIFPSGTDMDLVVRNLYLQLFMAGVALILIGLTGLAVGGFGLYDAIKGKQISKAFHSPGSIAGLLLFLFPASIYWFIFKDLGSTFSIISRIYASTGLSGIFSKIHPWEFIVPVTAGLILFIGSLLVYFRNMRKCLHKTVTSGAAL